MKFLFFLISALYTLPGQEVVVKPEMLSAKKWTITEDKQSGIGTHKAFPEGSSLEFGKDGTWTCSEMLEGAKKGKWSIDRDMIYLQNEDGKKTSKFKVVLLNEKQLRFEAKKTMYTRTWEWYVR